MDTPALNLDYVNACKLLLPQHKTVSLALVGCGGTGSWLAPSVVRVARLLVEKFDRKVRVTLVDPDTIEPKNVYRQNFSDCEVGRNKAWALAFRLGLAWGIEVGAVSQPFTMELARDIDDGADLSILIGCVDNPQARNSLSQAVEVNGWKPRWWLDCGNFKAAGQVLLGKNSNPPDKKDDPFKLQGFCTWLPSPARQHPELLEPVKEAAAQPDANLSCADLAMLDSQGLAINQAIAAQASDFLVRMLLTHDLQKFAVYLDLASGVTRARYITPENVL